MGTHDQLHHAISDFKRVLPGLTPVLTFVGAGPITWTDADKKPLFQFVNNDPSRVVKMWEEATQRLEKIDQVEQAMREQVRAAAWTGSRQAAKKRGKAGWDTRDAILEKAKELLDEGCERKHLATQVAAGLENDARDATRAGDPPPPTPGEHHVRRVLAKEYWPAADRRKDA